MAAKRCGICNISYPVDTKPDNCRVCGSQLVARHAEEPDDNWHELVVRKLRDPRVEWEGAHPKTEALVSVLEVPISGDQTLLFIPHQELIDMGYSALEDFNVVRVNGKFYELQGYNPPVEAWWVEEIQLPESSSAGNLPGQEGEEGS